MVAMCTFEPAWKFYECIMHYVPLSHLGTASAYITFWNVNKIYAPLVFQYKSIAQLTVYISHYTIPKSPKNY